MTDSALIADVRRQVTELGYELVEFRKAGPPQHLLMWGSSPTFFFWVP